MKKITPKLRLVLSAAVLACAVAAVIMLRTGQPEQAGGPVGPSSPTLPDISLSALPLVETGLVSDGLREALDHGSGLPPQQRLDMLAAISGNPGPADCEALLRALLQPRPVNMDVGWYAEFFHLVAGLLQRPDESRERFARALATIARDAGRGAIVRDYALQHLRQVWDSGEGELRRGVEATFRDAAASDDATIASSALLSLHFLGTAAGRDPLRGNPAPAESAVKSYAIPGADLEPLVGKILSEPASADHVTLRLTALRIVGDREMKRFRNDLRRVAADAAGEHAMVRMAAVSNLGRLGDVSDRAFLESIDRSGDGRVANAVERALSSLR